MTNSFQFRPIDFSALANLPQQFQQGREQAQQQDTLNARKAALAHFTGSNYGDLAKSLFSAGDFEGGMLAANADIKQGRAGITPQITNFEYGKQNPDFAKTQSAKLDATTMLANQRRQDKLDKITYQRQSAADSLDNLAAKGEDLLKNHAALNAASGYFKVGQFEVPGVYAKDVPNVSSDVPDFEAKLDSFKNQIALDVINTMRQASASGGAVGNMTQQEWPIIMNSINSLDLKQSPQALEANIKGIIQHARDLKAHVLNASKSDEATANAENDAVAGASNQAEANEGDEVQGPDGTSYVVRNGQLVPQ